MPNGDGSPGASLTLRAFEGLRAFGPSGLRALGNRIGSGGLSLTEPSPRARAPPQGHCDLRKSKSRKVEPLPSASKLSTTPPASAARTARQPCSEDSNTSFKRLYFCRSISSSRSQPSWLHMAAYCCAWLHMAHGTLHCHGVPSMAPPHRRIAGLVVPTFHGHASNGRDLLLMVPMLLADLAALASHWPLPSTQRTVRARHPLLQVRSGVMRSADDAIQSLKQVCNCPNCPQPVQRHVRHNQPDNHNHWIKCPACHQLAQNGLQVLLEIPKRWNPYGTAWPVPRLLHCRAAAPQRGLQACAPSTRAPITSITCANTCMSAHCTLLPLARQNCLNTTAKMPGHFYQSFSEILEALPS